MQKLYEIMKIYTRTGDHGTTSLFSGGRVPKYHLRVESYGTVDELNSVLGLARAQQPSAPTDAELARIQHQLFNLGADLATPLDAPTQHVVRMDAASIAWLEESIDRMTAELPALTYFILPGGSPAAATLHVARTVCRRAERLVDAASGAGSDRRSRAAVPQPPLGLSVHAGALGKSAGGHLRREVVDQAVESNRATCQPPCLDFIEDSLRLVRALQPDFRVLTFDNPAGQLVAADAPPCHAFGGDGTVEDGDARAAGELGEHRRFDAGAFVQLQVVAIIG